jgi:hypothetical protein
MQLLTEDTLHFAKRDSFQETKEIHKWSTRIEVSILKNFPRRLLSGGEIYNVVMKWNNNIIQQAAWPQLRYYTEGCLTSSTILYRRLLNINSGPIALTLCCTDVIIRRLFLLRFEYRETELSSARPVSSLSSFYTRALQRETRRFVVGFL